MKIKSLFIALLMVMVIMLTACQDVPNTPNTPDTPPSGEDDNPPAIEYVLPKDIPEATEPTMQIHYKRNNSADYLTWGFWLWGENKDGQLYELNYQDEYGAVAVYPISMLIDDFSGSGVIGMIPRLLASWTKDVDMDRMWDLSEFTMDENNFYHVYLTQGDGELYMTKDLIITPRITNATFASETTINISVSTKASHAKVFQNGDLIVEQALPNAGSGRVKLPAGFVPDFNAKYTVEITYTEGGTDTADVNMYGLFASDTFNDMYYYDGELGAIYDKANTTFRVWSPLSTEITLKLYNDGSEGDAYQTIAMTKGDKGVFETTVDGDLAEVYYTYTVKNNKYPEGKEIVDPYAKSAGLNGVRGQVVDFSETNPEGWTNVSPLDYDRKELTVWETHVADVTSSATWTGTENLRKKFLGMIESGTTYTKDSVTVSTGFDHIKELGVNAVQIIPIFDQANNEAEPEFNWGYNPLNYNVLEGSYSTDPTNGYKRINEFKQVVMAFNQEGISVIMDVVYNHTNGLEGSNFDVLMPGYYYRYTSNGKASNGSGCGNETASDNAMFRKFMIDSVCFWAKEYKLGGFRFDLMGLHDLETMNQLTAALKKINPNIVVYGEPWTGGTTTLNSKFQATQANGNSYEGYGQFNDQMRDALIKGGLSGKEELGWITDTTKVDAYNLTKIINGIKGTTQSAPAIADPNKTVNYVTCHDNYTLYDRMVAAGITDEEVIAKMAVLANSVVFTSQGTTFMLAGEEFLRTKQGSNNSYNLSYEVNELNYELKIQNINVFKAYQKLIAFKQDTDALHRDATTMGDFTVDKLSNGSVLKISFKTTDKEYVIFHANGTANGYTANELVGYTLHLNTLNVDESGEITAPYVVNPYATVIAYKAIDAAE